MPAISLISNGTYQISAFDRHEQSASQERKSDKSVGNSYKDFTHVHVRIFGRSYSDTNWEFTRDIEEEKMEF